MRAPMGSGHTSVVPYGALQTSDGHLIVAVFEKFWRGFCRALDRGDLEADARFATNQARVAHRAQLMPIIEEAVRRRPTAEWLAALQREGVPVAPIQTVDRVLADPQLEHRRMITTVSYPPHGRVPTLGTPIKVDGAMELEPAPPPGLGEHTDAVLHELLKYPEDRIVALRASGVVK